MTTVVVYAVGDPGAREFHTDAPSRFLRRWYNMPAHRGKVVWRAEIDVERAIRFAMIATQAAAADHDAYALEWLYNLDASIDWQRVGIVAEVAQ